MGQESTLQWLLAWGELQSRWLSETWSPLLLGVLLLLGAPLLLEAPLLSPQRC